MRVIGLTGGIASGKSTVSLLFRERGAAIIDADVIARDLLCPGTSAWSEVVKYFGEDILKDDGNIDRKQLGSIVFADEKKLQALNSITHPGIVEEIKRQVDQYRHQKREVVVIDAALLMEVGLDALVDEIWLVVIDERTQIDRLMAREKGLTFREALDRIRAQAPQEEKIKCAHRIINNSGTKKQTRDQFEAIWRDFCSS